MRNSKAIWAAAIAMLAFCLPAHSQEQELARRASWAQPGEQQVQAAVDRWLEQQQLDELTVAKIKAIWQAEENQSRLSLADRVVDTIALAEPRARELVALCRHSQPPTQVPTFELLDDCETPMLVRGNLRLLYGRYLAEHELYDEAAELLSELTVADVLDPAALLFYQSVVQYQRLDKERLPATVAKLLENEQALPRRYAVVARLMVDDLQPVDVGSLDEIARLMGDVRRRLNLGRAGGNVREVQRIVVAKLTDLIEDEPGDGPTTPRPPGPPTPGNPAPDSNINALKGRGDVDPSRIETNESWGNLSPEEKREVLQQITKDLPAHYREVIEAYFRRLARDER